MSRSLGDHITSDIGVIATPVVTKFSMEADHEYMLILASDGVWEFIESEEACNIVEKYTMAADGCAALIDESSRRWREEEGTYRDDITAIVCFFPFFPSDGDEEVKSFSFKVTPKSSAAGESNTNEGAPTAAAIAPSITESGESSKNPVQEKQPLEGGAPTGMNFERRRLTLQGNFGLGSEQAGQLAELQKEHGGE